ncbi:hypothetical protein LTR08_004441 [Meristemomyces frigidus]|nr:hypothetical protein LTR08_004441 [Meristemomyces frigidus]
MAEQKVDVFVCGGGPVGLLVSYQLARLGLSTYTVERYDKTQQAMYGRASTLYPRTNEMLDQLDLMDEMSQVGFIGRGSVTFRSGKRVHGRGWGFISRMYDTFFDYCLNIRQKYSENIFRAALQRFGGCVHAGSILENFTVDEKASDDYRVSVELTDKDGKPLRIKAKYIVGADGGRSSVRHIAGIPFEGEKTALHWIRIDAIIKTNMPDCRVGFGAIESPTHGNVLWVALDHGRTRIGFALTQELYDKYGENITEDAVKEEAVKAVAPFTLQFVMTDWWTLYSIGQRVAGRYQDKERVLLAGDAAHTHSSGAAQGMNTGMHDAVNLGWKLSGVLKGWYKPQILETYASERRTTAQHLIELDKSISSLISGKIPDNYSGSTHGGDANLMLNDVLELSAQFTIGLGVSYVEDGVLNRPSNIAAIKPGHRGPDVTVRKPGSKLPTRLYELTKNFGKFWVVIFAGEPVYTGQKLKALRSSLDGVDSFTKRLADVFGFITIIAGPGLQPDEVLGVESFGHSYYDVDHSAHSRYGITAGEGGIIILRPDGMLGCASQLDEGFAVAEYFNKLVMPRLQEHCGSTASSDNMDAKGEVELDHDVTNEGVQASARRLSIL